MGIFAIKQTSESEASMNKQSHAEKIAEALRKGLKKELPAQTDGMRFGALPRFETKMGETGMVREPGQWAAR